jgi:hypothetical protein
MLAEGYTIHAGQAFADPAHPGPLLVHAVGATSALITATDRIYDTSFEDFNAFIRECQEVKQQILTTVAKIFLQVFEYDVFGFADVSIIEMIRHLTIQPTEHLRLAIWKATATNLPSNGTRTPPSKPFGYTSKTFVLLPPQVQHLSLTEPPLSSLSQHYAKLESMNMLSPHGKTNP